MTSRIWAASALLHDGWASSVEIDIENYDPNDGIDRELFRQRMRNMSSQEREILISRD